MNRTARHPNVAPTALAIAISLSAANLHAADLPTGGNIVGGSGSISQAGNSLNVQQNSDKLITNWDSFDIGAGHTVNFYQPGSNSVALNRVIGEDASAIYGNLNANGKVFLVNPNGVLFGQGAAVNVGALVASTLSLSDQDFNDGNYQFSGDGNNAAVINRGTLNADQGAVALLGGQVSNHGIIQANQGTVALAAGDKITLDFAGDGLLNVTVDEGTLNALVENHQLVRANGGQVVMTANATNALLQTVVNNTGVIEAHTLDNQSGTIVLKGGFNGGTVNVAGTLDASAPNSGDGGFIDTSGAHVKIAGGTQVTTKANNGTTGEWLIDPTDFYITDSNDPQTASGIGAATLSANLENNNVTLATVDDGTEPGDMYVNGAVSWNADHTLSLNAHNDIHINQAITATNGGLTLNAGGNISANGAVNVDTFNLQSGAWRQLGSTLADFSARDFRLNTANASFLRANGGDGSEGNAYQIFDLYGLQGIASRNLLSSHFALSNNIDASGTANWNSGAGFVPIGDDANHYTGSFDGQGHSINSLTINRPNTDYVGLFGVISASQISNIALQNASVNGRLYVAGLVGQGRNSSRISHSSVTADLDGAFDIGVLAGSFNGTIEHSHSGGTVAFSEQTGGLVGRMTGQISDSYSTATVAGKQDIGGLVGVMDGSIDRSYATGNVTSNVIGEYERIGGLVGRLKGSVTDSYATGDVQGSYRAGGLAGISSGTITGSYARGAVQGSTYIGGLVGVNTGTISQSYASGNVNGSIQEVGGLVGTNDGAINYSYASGMVAGGLARIGGLVGRSTGSILGSYATGNVSGSEREIGGLVGFNAGGSASISQSYTTGRVSGPAEQTGALAGRNTGTITNSYWDTETSGQARAVGDGSGDGTAGLTTAQMFDAANFSGFDFADTWANADNQTTPYLRALAGNRVFNKNDLPTGTINATNRPALYTVIQNVEQLQAMRNNLSANYLLGNPIDASATASWNGGAGFVPVGNATYAYTGDFDGLGYSINGLTINRKGTDFVGLFGATRSGSVIRDIGLVGGSVSGRDHVGGLVGYNSATISNAYATGSIEGSKFVGGLLGYNTGIINNLYATGSVKGSDYSIGGLVGVSLGTISNAYATGSVEGSSSVGGLVGANAATITHAYATGSVSATDSAGGLVGYSSDSSTITNSYWNTDTSGQANAVGAGSSTGATGLTTAQMLQADSFAGWDIDAQGGTGTVWRIYEGYTAPLLRHFLTALEVNGDSATTYNGTDQSGTWSAAGEYDADHIFGQASGGGRNAGTYNIDISGLYSDQQGYDLITTNGTLTINKAQATVTANSGTTTYNGTEQSISGFTVNGLVNGEDESVVTGVTTSGGKGTNAGSYVLTVNGGSADNYELSFVDGALTINKAKATVTANSGTTTYNGTEQSVSGFTVDGLVNGEDKSVLTGVTTSGGKGTNAGSYTLIASGTDGNYELSFIDGALTINKAQATVTANSGTTTYNGTEQSVSGFTVDGLVNGEDASVLSGVTTNGGTGTNAGTYVLTASGTDGNYELTFVDGALIIDRKTITADIRALDKLFDGSLTATLEGVLNGTISGDDVALQLSGLFASLTPGENRVLVDASLTGADAGNYQLIAPDSVTANMQGFVQSEDYQSANVSQPPESRQLNAPGDAGYVLDIDDDALRLTASGQ